MDIKDDLEQVFRQKVDLITLHETMRALFRRKITDKLLFVIQRFELALKRTSDVADCDDLLRTPEGVDLFDATCVRIQTIGETLKQIDTETKEKLLVYYPGIP